MRHLGGEGDELKVIQEDLKMLGLKETLYGVIDNLHVNISTNEHVAKIRAMVLTQEDNEVLNWLRLNDTLTNHNLARSKHEPTTGNWFLESDGFQKWLNRSKSSLWLYGKPG